MRDGFSRIASLIIQFSQPAWRTHAAAFTAPPPPVGTRRAPLQWLRGGEAAEPPRQDFSKEATGVFFSMRLASLFPAGATFGGAFAMPPLLADPFLPVRGA